MKILLTGASSFTGYWFAKALAEAGHEVVAPLLRARDAYSGDIRADRVKRLEGIVKIEAECGFGSDRFMKLVDQGFDVLAHHAAQVGDYRSPDFDILGAVSSNTKNLRQILSSGQVGAMVLTSSVFAPGEGVGTMPLRAFSPYGLSKGMTNEYVSYVAQQAGISLGRFVIPNPFGPLEEPRFCAYLMRTWKAGDAAKVNTPVYVRDNIHVDLLSRAYVRFIADLSTGKGPSVIHPSGYVSSQGDFAERFAREMRPRLGLACELQLLVQTDFSEPLMRVNVDPAAAYVPGWDEVEAWNRVAAAYR